MQSIFAMRKARPVVYHNLGPFKVYRGRKWKGNGSARENHPAIMFRKSGEIESLGMNSFGRRYSICTENQGIITTAAANAEGILRKDLARWVKSGTLPEVLEVPAVSAQAPRQQSA